VSADPGLARALLAELAASREGISLPRLCKRLGIRMSVLLRTLAWLGESSIADAPGPDWVRVVGDGERRIAVLTQAGREQAAGVVDAQRVDDGALPSP
jgi:hypothetical protein